ncbi:MAG TPA: phosphate ABC transporter substrate-binding protein PstS [Archaeoglobus profundus]|nr:phosphate ABC transporter substrate-binding protein PstS [Archaeoglobus profundus]HIP58026.1 phosphate ABC transporter substrate-binding protein PstS [Archaeoglobus profundus]
MKGKQVIIPILIILSILWLGCIQQGPTTPQAEHITIHGSGATFPLPQIEKWIDAYSKLHPNVKIEYIGKGSGAGQRDFKERLVDFACSDPPLKEKLWKELEKMGQPLQFPIITGAVVVVYNVPGVNNLRLDGETLAEIFMGKIEYWDDPKIKELNPDVKLPHEKIWVIHRSDASGTTKIFTTYLSIVSEEWANKVGAGKVVDWPVDKLGRGIGAKGNPGVVNALKQTKYSIAYTELAYALKENLKMVALKNKAGKYIIANDTTIKAAVAKAGLAIPSPYEGYKEDLKRLLNVDDENAYPIVAISHIIVWKEYDDKKKEEAIRNFVKWILTDGQKEEYIVPGYVGLPKELCERLLKEVGWI